MTAVIKSDGSDTHYLIWIRKPPRCVKYGCEIAFDERVIAQGTVGAGKSKTRRTRVVLAPETWCEVGVEASNALGEGQPEAEFETLAAHQ